MCTVTPTIPATPSSETVSKNDEKHYQDIDSNGSQTFISGLWIATVHVESNTHAFPSLPSCPTLARHAPAAAGSSKDVGIGLQIRPARIKSER